MFAKSKDNKYLKTKLTINSNKFYTNMLTASYRTENRPHQNKKYILDSYKITFMEFGI